MSRKARYTKEAQENSLFIKPFIPKNSSQEFYVDTMKESTITLCTGPAGTSKTYVAAYVALQALLNRDIDRIILTRPIVACEDIGFLPGDMLQKVNPYLLPLIDAVEDHIGPTRTKELFDTGRLEIIPLAYMRGRSLNRAFMILDEAQNATIEQVKMFLTRLGYESKIVINGDPGQSDLKPGTHNGLEWALERLTGVESEIGCVEFSESHIVRHPLIAKMLRHLNGPGRSIKLPTVDKKKLNGGRHSFYDPEVRETRVA